VTEADVERLAAQIGLHIAPESRAAVAQALAGLLAAVLLLDEFALPEDDRAGATLRSMIDATTSRCRSPRRCAPARHRAREVVAGRRSSGSRGAIARSTPSRPCWASAPWPTPTPSTGASRRGRSGTPAGAACRPRRPPSRPDEAAPARSATAVARLRAGRRVA